jgi:hypothetical protein
MPESVTGEAGTSEAGMATAEFACAIPALLVVFVLALSAITTVTDQVRCVDAARATARALARGDSDAAALEIGHRLAPSRAAFTVARSEREVTVVVRGVPAPGLRWIGSRVSPAGQAVAAREDLDGAAELDGTAELGGVVVGR